jgi:2-polyprenyl-6-methoxyphenol hydroxylase-like FAD-dependent oxidoreductase
MAFCAVETQNGFDQPQSRENATAIGSIFDRMSSKTVLISGVGIAGPTLAFWLKRGGFEPTLLESAPGLRSGGYVIDFWGLGYDIAERMGLTDAIERVGYHMREMRIVDENGRRIAGFGTRVFRELTGGRFVTIGRSDLSRLLFDKVSGATETIFGDEIVSLREHSEAVEVQFRNGQPRQFGLVIGADGLHSNVRRLTFGSQDRFETYLGYYAAAFEVNGYRPRDENVYVIYNQPGRMLGRFALHDDRTLFLFVFTVEGSGANLNTAKQKAILRQRFGDGSGECPRVLSELDRTENLYFDRVSQIKMERWSRGRVALVGDAAFCVSLMAGQGSALAITAAYVMAGELTKSSGQYEEAFSNYEALLRGYISAKQKGAERFSSAFAPRNRLGLFMRNLVIKASAIPGLAKLAFGRDIIDKLPLPDYRWP